MAKRRRKSTKFNVERLAAVAGGAAVGLFLNGIIVKATAKVQNQNTKNYIAKAVPFAKMAGGAYLAATQKGMLADAGLGLVAEGAVEGALKLAPKTFSINGFGDDMMVAGFGDDQLVAGGFQVLPLNTADVSGAFSHDETTEVYGYGEDYNIEESFEDFEV